MYDFNELMCIDGWAKARLANLPEWVQVSLEALIISLSVWFRFHGISTRFRLFIAKAILLEQ